MDLDYFGPRAWFRLVVFHFKYLLVSWNNHRLVKKLVRREIHASLASFPVAAGGDNIWPITLLLFPSFFCDKFHSFALTYFSRTSRGNNNRGIFLIPPPRPEESHAICRFFPVFLGTVKLSNLNTGNLAKKSYWCWQFGEFFFTHQLLSICQF